jgi:hypothetical protein
MGGGRQFFISLRKRSHEKRFELEKTAADCHCSAKKDQAEKEQKSKRGNAACGVRQRQ